MSLKEYINHKNKKIKENAESVSDEEEETSSDDNQNKNKSIRRNMCEK